MGTERIRFFDGSDLKGTLLELDQENNLFWRHESSYEPIRFKFRAIESVVLDRFSKTDVDPPQAPSPHTHENGDKLRCDFKKLDENNLVVQTSFAKEVKVPVENLLKMEFLPRRMRFFTIPRKACPGGKAAIGNHGPPRKATWFRSIREYRNHLAPKGRHRGRVRGSMGAFFLLGPAFLLRFGWIQLRKHGYHLSFSNNRLNLQVNKRTKGRVSRNPWLRHDR